MKKVNILSAEADTPSKALDELQKKIDSLTNEIQATFVKWTGSWSDVSVSETRVVTSITPIRQWFTAYVTVTYLKAKDDNPPENPDGPNPFRD